MTTNENQQAPSAVASDLRPILDELIEEIEAGIAVLQSPYLYLQAAGSDGSDGSAVGRHLRWALLRSLENYLPKGNLASGPGASYPASYGFNKTDDFVELLRVPYLKARPCVVNFSSAQASEIVETGPQRLWKFEAAVPFENPGHDREVIIRFADVSQYDTIRATIDPHSSLTQFLSLYEGVVEAEVTNQLCFGLTVSTGLVGDLDGYLRVEAISVAENLPGADFFISCRRRFPLVFQISPAPVINANRMIAENVRYFRFDYDGCTPLELRLETYEQFIVSTLSQPDAAWEVIGDGFSLTDQDAVAFDRLENSTLANVNHKWPRYFGAVAASGLFTASVPNYRAKWDPTLPPTLEPTDANGLRKGVISYLTLSMNPANPTALASLPAQNPGDGGAFDISYLEMLKLVALDFHCARMLGLGCIDADVLGPTAPTKYIYVAIYRTLAALEPGSPVSPRTHLYLTLPTSLLDHRRPPAPVQEPPSFGITFDNGTGTPTQLTDAAGYNPFDESRVINLHLKSFDTVQALGPFFAPPTEFCSSEMTKPVFYGCKYKAVSETNYRVPELSNDPEFLDPSGIAEVAPLLPQLSDDPNVPNPIYTHEEKENGLHRYVLYGVNWYSRPSQLSNPQDVQTLFPERHTLLPPANLAVQLIQQEDPLILTTTAEQQKLASLSSDSTLLRCTFNWNQNQYIPQRFSATNVYANKVQFYFRQEPPRAVQGEIKSVISISDTLAEVRSRPYTLTSISPPQTVAPAVIPGDEPRFAGSSFVANQVLYVVDSVVQSAIPGEGAVIRIRKQRRSTVSELDNNNQHSAVTEISIPSAGERFLMVENMNEPGNWGADQPLAKEVELVNFLESGQLHTETVSYSDGSQARFNIGGIQQLANIVELKDIDSSSPTTPPRGDPIPGSKTGIFEISFTSYELANHPDPTVEWYKGTVRVREATGNDIKVLEVWEIDVSGVALKLTAYDPTFNVDSNYVPRSGYRPIQTGTGVTVNFHPGYRVYLQAQPGVFDQSTLFPGAAQSSKQTFLAARSRNTVLADVSNLTAPVVIQARKINPPLAPKEPIGPLYATRPNSYGKATWTLDVKVTLTTAHEPYALVFYRANERAILDTLYKGTPPDGAEPARDTVDGIEAALKALSPEDAAFATNRWRDLVNVQNLHSDHGFPEYTSGGFRFPIPNNASYMIPGTTIAPFDGVRRPGDPSVTFMVGGVQLSMLDVVKGAIESVFLPLTESPLIFQFLKQATQTSSKKPVIRDANGDLLPFTSPAFDPSPMAVKYVSPGGDTFVRFTDYTLDGAALNIYFYFVVELSDQMKLSPRSPIAGPIKLVNAYPAEAPVIRKVTSIISDPILQISTGVRLLVNAYITAEGITKFNLYRATNANDAAAPRTMKLVRSYDAEIGAETEILDDFSDLDFLPFGDPLFYRVVALREITNERDETEYIPSQPSTLARASILDVDNPVAPLLVFSSDPPTMSQPVQLTNVVLSWPKVTHNATYYLYKQNGFGNWNKVYQEKTDANPVIVPLSATDLGAGALSKQDADGRPIYHRFKVDVENTSGLFSLNEEVLTVPATCIAGYSFIDVPLSYEDDFQSASPLSDRLCDPAVSTFPGTMRFQDIISSLPTAHVFDRIEITVADGLGHAAKKIINMAGGSVTFHHGEGSGIVLDGSETNVDYAIRARVFTDSCQDGLLFSYTLRFGPQIALMEITSLLSYTDGTSTTSPLEPFIALPAPFPAVMTFTDISVLPAGHSFSAMEIQVRDDRDGSFSRSISIAGGNATFKQGDGGLGLDASTPNATYQVSARLFTDLTPNGVLFQYRISYG